MKALWDINEWLDAQDERVQEHIATAILTRLGFQPEEIASPGERPLRMLERWLASPADIQAKVARIVIFRALLNFCVGERFAGDGWDEIEELYSSILRDPNARPATREMAAAYLADLPELKVEWVRAGASWLALSSGSLSDLSLRLATKMHEFETTGLLAGFPPPDPTAREMSRRG
jgi:hypothetical protein